jgi:hypothetical protein
MVFDGYSAWVAGAAAGAVNLLVGHPMDTIKVRLQTTSAAQFSSPLDCAIQTIRNEGVSGLYKGIVPPFIGRIVTGSVMFGAFDFTTTVALRLQSASQPRQQQQQQQQQQQSETQSELSIPAVMVCGAATGWLLNFVVTPIDQIKCVMQVQYGDALLLKAATAGLNGAGRMKLTGSGGVGVGVSASNAKLNVAQGTLTVIRNRVSQFGLWKGLYGNFGITGMELSGCAMYFGTYVTVSRWFAEHNRHSAMEGGGGAAVVVGERPALVSAEARNMKAKTQSRDSVLNKCEITTTQSLIAGGLSGGSWLCVFPIDVIKSRMLTQSSAVSVLPRPNHLPLGPALTPVAQHLSAWRMARHVWRTEGSLPFRRGFTPALARAVVANSVSFAVYNKVMELMSGKSSSNSDDEW